MKEEKEITIEVDCSLSKLNELLAKNHFIKKEAYDLNDIYLVNALNKDNKDYLDLLNNCVLIRHIKCEDHELKLITYKYKEYNSKKEIIKQSKTECAIESIDDAIKLFEKLKYERLIAINDHLTVYSNGEDELVVQCVNDKHIYIEIEDECHFSNKVYNSVEEMKAVIINNQIPFKNNNFFAKKAEIEIAEKYDIN